MKRYTRNQPAPMWSCPNYVDIPHGSSAQRRIRESYLERQRAGKQQRVTKELTQ